jgi:hypothetical protein
MIEFFNDMTEKKFSKLSIQEIVLITDSTKEAIDHFKNYKETNVPDKFF